MALAVGYPEVSVQCESTSNTAYQVEEVCVGPLEVYAKLSYDSIERLSHLLITVLGKSVAVLLQKALLAAVELSNLRLFKLTQSTFLDIQQRLQLFGTMFWQPGNCFDSEHIEHPVVVFAVEFVFFPVTCKGSFGLLNYLQDVWFIIKECVDFLQKLFERLAMFG